MDSSARARAAQAASLGPVFVPGGAGAGDDTLAQAGPRTRLQRRAAQSHPDLSHGSVGHTLLRKAGWTPGTGLGKEEQGPTAPVQAFAKAGRQGLGAEAGTLQLVGEAHPPEATGPAKRPRTEAYVGEAAAKQSAADAAAAARDAAVATQRASRDKAIRAELYRAFAEPDDSTRGAHVLQRAQPSRGNPLRHMFR